MPDNQSSPKRPTTPAASWRGFGGLGLSSSPELVQVVGPHLHHLPPFRQERCPVVRPTVGIPDRVGQLVLDEVGPGRSGPAFWVATPRSALRRPCPRRAWRGRRRESAGHRRYRPAGAGSTGAGSVLPGARYPKGRRRGRPETRAAISRSSCWSAGSRARRVRLRRSRPQDPHGAPLLARRASRPLEGAEGAWPVHRGRGRRPDPRQPGAGPHDPLALGHGIHCIRPLTTWRSRRLPGGGL